jgi:hypothetical protein
MSETHIWAYLIHLSYNMWADWKNPEVKSPYYACQPQLRCDDALWRELIARMRDGGVNMVVIDVGDGVQFASHPEIPVKNAWSRTKLRDEIAHIRELGMEPIPKLNFSACHDQWLGVYARQVSTPPYYQVVKDLIAETIELFDTPRLFHLGMDEEAYVHQRHFEYVVIRQFDLWWRDFQFLVDQLKPKNIRPWIWSDMVWVRNEEFLNRMSKQVLQSNWWYERELDPKKTEVKAYVQLEERGFDQVPTFSNWEHPENCYNTVRFAKEHIAPQRLKGFIHCPWRPTLPETRDRHLDAIDNVSKARKLFEQHSAP